MTSRNTVATQPGSISLTKRMVLGGAIGLVLITVFLIGVKNPDPAWGKLWMLQPLVIVPLAGAGGALFYHLVNQHRFQNEWIKLLAKLAGVIGFLVALWLGSVLGLNGTLWN